MRLTCPNCGAQYEVASAMIPPEGRDVQCSACSYTWYQAPANRTLSAVPGTAADRGRPPRSDDAPPDEPPDDPPHDAPREDPPRPELDPATRAILEEEAAREIDARRAEAAPPPPPDRRRQPPRDPAPSRRTTAQAVPDEDHDDPGVDVDEINSTLTPSSTRRRPRRPDPPEAAPRRSRAPFRAAFVTVVGLAAAAILLYAVAPALADAAPALEPQLAAYVEAVNEARTWIDARLATAMTRIEELTG